MAKAYLDLEVGVPRLWTKIKSKVGDYLPLAGGTMQKNAAVTAYGSPSITLGNPTDDEEGYIGDNTLTIKKDSIDFWQSLVVDGDGSQHTQLSPYEIVTSNGTFTNSLRCRKDFTTNKVQFSHNESGSVTINDNWALQLLTDNISDEAGTSGILGAHIIGIDTTYRVCTVQLTVGISNPVSYPYLKEENSGATVPLYNFAATTDAGDYLYVCSFTFNYNSDGTSFDSSNVSWVLTN